MAPTIERSQPSGSRARGPNLTPYERGRIVQAYEDGRTLESIADQFHRAPSTISRTVRGASTHNEGTELPRSGRPRTYTPRDRRRVELAVKRHPFWSYNKIKKWYGFTWSNRTMRRILEPYGIKKWLAKKRPLLTRETAHKRYHFAKRLRNWPISQWMRVLFSDECSVERGASHMRRFVFRSAGQQYDRGKVTNYNKSKEIRVMVWAAISTAGLSDLLVMRRDLSAKNQGFTSQSYIKVLEDGLLPILQANSIYQQDGARIHTSKLAKSWFEKHGIHVLKYWPPYSPDLNPIEHLWPLLKEALYQLYPDIELWKGGEDKVAERMEDALVHAWGTIRDSIAYNCVASMPERLQAVYSARGWYTRY